MQTLIERASTGTDGQQANSWSFSPSISADGRYVAFASSANNLVAGDTNSVYDIFVKDLETGTTTLVNTDSDGRHAINYSYDPQISADGRYVAFYSYASNLVASDTNGNSDIFVKDLVTGTTTRVNTDSEGRQANNYSASPSISADGRYIAFYSYGSNLVAGDTNRYPDLFVKDVVTGTTTRVNTDSAGRQANGYSYDPSISADGRYVAFQSDASNLVDGDTNGSSDVFVKDLTTGVTIRVSTDIDGGQGNTYSGSPVISADGHHVAFQGYASNLVGGDTNGTDKTSSLPACRTCHPRPSAPRPPIG